MDILPTNYHHILNGDALKAQMAETPIAGSVIIMRECLMDGPLDGDFPEGFYQKRAEFLAIDIGGFSEEQYYSWTVKELDKIPQIPEDSNICLWFENDLFCQANMWFVVHLLFKKGLVENLYWARPLESSPYSFGHLVPADLIRCFEMRQRITKEEALIFVQLWEGYVDNNISRMRALGEVLTERFPMVRAAVELHRDRLPNGDDPGRPVRVLKEIVKKVGQGDFGKVFRLFQERVPEYGYGDLQVRRLLKELK